MATFTLYLPDSLLAALDEKRGPVSRSALIKEALINHLGLAIQDVPSPKATRSPKPAEIVNEVPQDIKAKAEIRPGRSPVPAPEKPKAQEVADRLKARGLPVRAGYGGIGGKPPIPKRGR